MSDTQARPSPMGAAASSAPRLRAATRRRASPHRPAACTSSRGSTQSATTPVVPATPTR